MAGIKVFFPQQGHTFPYPLVAATGRYKRPQNIKGTLTRLNGDEVYAGKLIVMLEKLWALGFGPVVSNSRYILHIFDSENPDIRAEPIKVKVAGGAVPPATAIIYPATGEILYDRAVPMVGFTNAPEITAAEIRHGGKLGLAPTESFPITPTVGFWSASFTIPSDYPCPGDSPDYTAHVEDSRGSHVPESEDIKLDMATFCPETELKERKAKAKKKKAKKKKKKARSKKK